MRGWSALWFSVLAGCNQAPPTPLHLAAAANLTAAARELAAGFTAASGLPVSVNLASSGQLTQQIEQGAPVDLFLAADTASIDRLREQKLVGDETTAIYARGRLALWSRTMSVGAVAELADPRVRRVAIANPVHAPYGAAARRALEAAGIWTAVQPKLVLADNVRQALQFAEADADVAAIAAALAPTTGHLLLVPTALCPPLDQGLAVPVSAPQPDAARRLRTFILGETGRQILQRHGYDLPGA